MWNFVKFEVWSRFHGISWNWFLSSLSKCLSTEQKAIALNFFLAKKEKILLSDIRSKIFMVFKERSIALQCFEWQLKMYKREMRSMWMKCSNYPIYKISVCISCLFVCMYHFFSETTQPILTKLCMEILSIYGVVLK